MKGYMEHYSVFARVRDGAQALDTDIPDWWRCIPLDSFTDRGSLDAFQYAPGIILYYVARDYLIGITEFPLVRQVHNKGYSPFVGRAADPYWRAEIEQRWIAATAHGPAQ